MTRVAMAAVVVTAACAGPRSSGGATPPDSTPSVAGPARPLDSLVLTTRSGHQIWLAEGREARDSGGVGCYERSVEIRSDSTRIKVPLLFVTAAPTEWRPGSIRAELSRHCRVMAIYQVDLATGRPIKLEDR